MPSALYAGGTCTQMRQWGLCNAQWVLDANYCRATCGVCNGPPPPPAPPPSPPPPPQPNLMSASFNTAGSTSDGYYIWINNNGKAGYPQVGCSLCCLQLRSACRTPAGHNSPTIYCAMCVKHMDTNPSGPSPCLLAPLSLVPQGTYSFGVAAAGYSSAAGLSVTLNTLSSTDWHVQLLVGSHTKSRWDTTHAAAPRALHDVHDKYLLMPTNSAFPFDRRANQLMCSTAACSRFASGLASPPAQVNPHPPSLT